MVLPGILSHPLVFNTLVLIASLYILIKSADLIVDSISSYARKLGLSDAIIGLVVVAMAASSAEIVSSVTGFITGYEEIGLGTVLGNNMIHAALALGLLATFGGKIKLEPNIFTKQRLAMWLALMLPFVLAADGLLSRSDGVVLLTAFALYLLYLWKIEGTFGKIKKDVKIKNIWQDALIFLGCFAALLLAGRWLVFSSVQIADYFNISEYFVGLVLISLVVTADDFAIELKSLFKKHSSIGLGDLLGSLLIELLLLLGIVSVIKPLEINVPQVLNALIFLSLSITVMMSWMNKKYLTRKHGLILIGLYAAFITIEIWKIL
ncbi:sodium:calcium antiporter [Candidatus Woesearchaeota archaeon]|nr:MAG: sodium:calcium antiporter [Candidatus Woesearchaeota archaeon]